MKRILCVLPSIILFCALSLTPAGALEHWDAAAEVARLSAEAPALAAFPGTSGVVWMSSDRYSLSASGGKQHDSIFVLLLGANAISSKKFPYPAYGGAALEITEAAWYDPSDGKRLGDLPKREYDENGIKGMEVLFPDAAEGQAVAVTTTETVPGEYRLDDVIFLSGELPAWEQSVEVELPEGMNLYWTGVGVLDPERKKNGRTQLMTWTVLNEPAWVSSGLVDSGRPSLAFSLDHGQLAGLKKLRSLENPPYAPPIPPSVSSVRANLAKTIENISEYMSSLSIPRGNGAETVRAENVPAAGPWTGWEQALIAGRWLSSLGFDVNVYWTQSVPVGSDGPSSPKIWHEPVLKVSDKAGHEMYFKAGQSGDPEKPHPSLYGAALYRAGNNGVEKITLPKGSASDNALSQSWKVRVDENGRAAGTLNITLTGGWMDVFAIDSGSDSDAIAAGVLNGMNLNVPGTSLALKSAKSLPSGCRLSFEVESAPGIASSGNMLLKLMGALPSSLA
ncbi:MAG: hypothetical protein LBU26_03085, partial [Synergistaceae bacterium]|nr:hypothetical protein [Synergistaceae bacterium]